MGGNMMNDAGKVLLKPKGRYDSLTTYEILDCVTYNGNAYVAKKTTVGNLPTEDGEYWCILIENVEITPTFTIAQNLEELKSGEQYQITFGKIAKAVKDYILHKVVKATNTQLGHVKVTNSAAVTDSTGLALAATEKNASIEGTLANLISQQNSNLVAVNAARWGDVQPNTNIVIQSSIQWNTWGSICFVYVYAHIKIDNKYTDYVLATGLPYAKFGYTPLGVVIDQDTNKHFTIYVKDRTKLVIGSNVNAPYEGHIRGFIGYCFNQT